MWYFIVCMILCGLIWFSIVYYDNVFPGKVSNGLVWVCMVLYGLTQLCTIFVLVAIFSCSYLVTTGVKQSKLFVRFT